MDVSLDHSDGSLLSEDALDTEDDALDTGDDLDVSVDELDTPDESDLHGHTHTCRNMSMRKTQTYLQCTCYQKSSCKCKNDTT